jgi:hypothetical protein
MGRITTLHSGTYRLCQFSKLETRRSAEKHRRDVRLSVELLNYWPLAALPSEGADQCALGRAPRGSGSNRALNDNAGISTAARSWSRALARGCRFRFYSCRQQDAKREDKQRAEEYTKDTDPTPIVVEASDDPRARWDD